MKLIITEEQLVELEARFNWRIPLREVSMDGRVTGVLPVIPLKGKSVLDVGTLDGFITASLVEAGAVVTTIDCRMSNLALAWTRLRALGMDVSSVEFLLGDVERLPVDGRWQVIFHSGTFYHLPNPVMHLHYLLPYFTEHLVLETHTFTDGLQPGEIAAFGRRFTGGWYKELGMLDPASSRTAQDSFWLDHSSLKLLFSVLNLDVVSEVYRDRTCEAGPRSCWVLKKGGA